MRLDQNPVYRREIIPWYDSEIACVVIWSLMISTLLIGAIGIAVVHQKPEYRPHIWVPILVMVLSFGVLLSSALRITVRYLRRMSA